MRGWEVGKKSRWNEVLMFPHQTALNGRPGAVEVGGGKIGKAGMDSCATPDRPKWTARSGDESW